ncbi:MAG: TetR/AcrR family transcriptional regulator [Ruminococcus sp.]|nr:TetR/AcrR family transcriptional regulator [Ruminococcus sp.]
MGRERQIKKNEATRKAILDTAVAIGLEEGFGALSIRKITDKLGYSSGIVYHYFKDKQEILNTIHTQTSISLKDAVVSCISPERSFAENTRLVFNMLSEAFAYEPHMFKLILLNKFSNGNESVIMWVDMIKQCIELGVKSGELRDIDTEITAYVLLNSFLVSQMVITERKTVDENTIKHIFDTELDIILNGILNKE